MNSKTLLSPLALLLALASPAIASEKLFSDLKCNKCHAVSAYGIEKVAGDDDDEESDGKVSDLSNVGTLPKRNAEYLKKFLMKETSVLNSDGTPGTKNHKLKFKGTEAQLNEMVTWLTTLNKAPTK